MLGGVCYWCVGMYIFMMSIGVMSLLLITRAWRYGDIGLGVGILVMLLFVWVDLCIIANLPPLTRVDIENRLHLYAVIFVGGGGVRFPS